MHYLSICMQIERLSKLILVTLLVFLAGCDLDQDSVQNKPSVIKEKSIENNLLQNAKSSIDIDHGHNFSSIKLINSINKTKGIKNSIVKDRKGKINFVTTLSLVLFFLSIVLKVKLTDLIKVYSSNALGEVFKVLPIDQIYSKTIIVVLFNSLLGGVMISYLNNVFEILYYFKIAVLLTALFFVKTAFNYMFEIIFFRDVNIFNHYWRQNYLITLILVISLVIINVHSYTIIENSFNVNLLLYGGLIMYAIFLLLIFLQGIFKYNYHFLFIISYLCVSELLPLLIIEGILW